MTESWERVRRGMLCSRKMFNFLIRKDIRKILKRKDSDAGERGKVVVVVVSLIDKAHFTCLFWVLCLLFFFFAFIISILFC